MSQMSQEGPTTDRDRKIKIIQERLKTTMHPDIRKEFEGLLAQLQGVEVKKVEPLPLPPVKPAIEPLEAAPKKSVTIWTPSGEIEVVREEPLKPEPKKTVRVWSPSGYIEVARSEESKHGVEGPQSGDGTVAIDVCVGDKISRSPEPIPEPVKPAAVGGANQAAERGSPTLEETQERTGGRAERTEGHPADGDATGTQAQQRPVAGVKARTQQQLLTLVLGTVWIIASGFLSDDLFQFATFAFPGVAAAGLVYAALSGQFRRSRLIVLAAVAGWVAMALFIGFHDCCVTPAEALRHYRPLDPGEHSHQLRTPSAVELEMFRLSIPGILLGMVALWWMRRKDAEKSRTLE